MNKFSNFAVFFDCFLSIVLHISEAVAGGIMRKAVSQNSQESTFAGVLFLMKKTSRLQLY